jgi:hypothetical protein
MGLIVWIIVKKGADKLGITSIMENATYDAVEIAKNASRGIIGNSLTQ